MTIKGKLSLATVIMALTLLIIGVTVLFGYRYVTGKASLANDFDNESMYLQMMLRGLNEVIINEGMPSSLRTETEGMSGFDKIHTRLLAEIKDPEFRKILIEEIDPQWRIIKEGLKPFHEHYVDLDNDEMMIQAGALIIRTEKMIQRIKVMAEKTRAIVDENSEKSAIVEKMIIFMIVFTHIAFIILSRHIYKSISRPIEELTRIAEGFNRGDLNMSMDESKKDEFGLLAVHFNKSVAKLKQINQELQDFAHVSSHDLQEPLRKVLAFSNRLQTKYSHALGDQGRDYLNRMENAASRMQHLINGLLMYSRIATKARPFVPVDLSSVTQAVLTDLEMSIQETRGQVAVEDLPMVNADPLQMRQLFQNLISNALKFRKKDEHPMVKVSAECIRGDKGMPDDSSYQIIVEDNGIGFDEKYAERIFSVFQRLHTRTEYDGTGIGLSVCRRIVERHGGNIAAKSAPGEGAKFIVTLPVQPYEEEHAGLKSAANTG